jgi:hypothetical protein
VDIIITAAAIIITGAERYRSKLPRVFPYFDSSS